VKHRTDAPTCEQQTNMCHTCADLVCTYRLTVTKPQLMYNIIWRFLKTCRIRISYALKKCLPDQCRDDPEVLQSPHRTPCMSTAQDIPAKTDDAKCIQS